MNRFIRTHPAGARDRAACCPNWVRGNGRISTTRRRGRRRSVSPAPSILRGLAGHAGGIWSAGWGWRRSRSSTGSARKGSRGGEPPARCSGRWVPSKQVCGWKEVLVPGLRDPALDPAIWPFSGRLAELAQPGKLVIAETYPAEYYPRLAPLVAGEWFLSASDRMIYNYLKPKFPSRKELRR